MKIYNKYLIFSISITGIIATNNDFVLYKNFNILDNKYLLGTENSNSNVTKASNTPQTINNNNNNINNDNIFDISKIVKLYMDDVKKPSFITNADNDFNIFDINASPECIEVVKSKYGCIKLQNNDFNSFCDNFEKNCGLFSESSKTEISKRCDISVELANDFILSINNLLSTKKYFCIKKPVEEEKKENDKDKKDNETNETDETDDSNDDNKDRDITVYENDLTTNPKCENIEDNINKPDNITISAECNEEEIKKLQEEKTYCPITVSLQHGYLNLIKQVEYQNEQARKSKRSPIISDVNSFIPSRSIDLQVIKRRLIDDLKRNCKYNYCRDAARNYINNIKKDYSYFNVMYQYQVNDDTLKKNIQEILNDKNCSGVSLRFITSNKFLLAFVSIVILLIL